VTTSIGAGMRFPAWARMSEANLRPTCGPRERLLERGLESLSDAELLALLLGTGSPSESVLPLAERILRELSGLKGLVSCSPSELMRVRGVGASKAARVVAALELGRRASGRPLARGSRMRSSEDVARAFAPQLAHLTHEELWALALDARQRVLTRMLVARGGLSVCPVSPADLFRPLVREAASAFVLVHNHPSGAADPSQEDLELTRRMARAAELLGLTLLDHVIVAADGYVSLLDAGLFRGEA
jgi:DNA repair protein RadC